MGINVFHAALFITITTVFVTIIHYKIAQKKGLPPVLTAFQGGVTWFFFFPIGLLYLIYNLVRKSNSTSEKEVSSNAM